MAVPSGPTSSIPYSLALQAPTTTTQRTLWTSTCPPHHNSSKHSSPFGEPHPQIPEWHEPYAEDQSSSFMRGCDIFLYHPCQRPLKPWHSVPSKFLHGFQHAITLTISLECKWEPPLQDTKIRSIFFQSFPPHYPTNPHTHPNLPDPQTIVAFLTTCKHIKLLNQHQLYFFVVIHLNQQPCYNATLEQHLSQTIHFGLCPLT